MLTLAKAKNGPLVSYLQKEYKDAENGAITDSKNSASSSYTPFIAPQKSSAEFRQQNLENLHVFLQSKALHAVSTPFRRRFVQKLAYSHLALAPAVYRSLQELLQRYNPTTGMTEGERIRLTARRVGLDVPITHDASAESANNYRKSAQIAQDQYKQDKDNREDQLYSGKGDGLNVGGPLRPRVFKE